MALSQMLGKGSWGGGGVESLLSLQNNYFDQRAMKELHHCIMISHGLPTPGISVAFLDPRTVTAAASELSSH